MRFSTFHRFRAAPAAFSCCPRYFKSCQSLVIAPVSGAARSGTPGQVPTKANTTELSRSRENRGYGNIPLNEKTTNYRPCSSSFATATPWFDEFARIFLAWHFRATRPLDICLCLLRQSLGSVHTYMYIHFCVCPFLHSYLRAATSCNVIAPLKFCRRNNALIARNFPTGILFSILNFYACTKAAKQTAAMTG